MAINDYFTGIQHVGIPTQNLEATIACYETLGFKKSGLAFAAVKAAGLMLVDQEIQSIPTFWENGIRYFNILGPNQETIEFCQIL